MAISKGCCDPPTLAHRYADRKWVSIKRFLSRSSRCWPNDDEGEERQCLIFLLFFWKSLMSSLATVDWQRRGVQRSGSLTLSKFRVHCLFFVPSLREVFPLDDVEMLVKGDISSESFVFGWIRLIPCFAATTSWSACRSMDNRGISDFHWEKGRSRGRPLRKNSKELKFRIFG